MDEYLRDSCQLELGLKRRDSRKGIEIKGLVAVTADALTTEPFKGPIELWTKWISEPLELDRNAMVRTEKRRWLRKFDTTPNAPQEIPVDSEEKPLDNRPLSPLGCNVELTQVKLPNGEDWWTLGFEAFGTMQNVESSLRAVAVTLATRCAPTLKNGLLASYPRWLSKCVLASQA